MQIYVSSLQRFAKTNYSKSLSFVFKIEKNSSQPTAPANESRGFLTRSVKFSFGQILQFSGWILCWGRRLLLSNLTNWAHYEPRMLEERLVSVANKPFFKHSGRIINYLFLCMPDDPVPDQQKIWAQKFAYKSKQSQSETGKIQGRSLIGIGGGALAAYAHGPRPRGLRWGTQEPYISSNLFHLTFSLCEKDSWVSS